VVAGPEYKAGGLHRLLLGNHYRSVWTAPVEVPELDLGTYAGGLTPKKKGGGKQTKSLSFKGADGREFKFRSVDKDPTPTLPEGFEDTVADWLVQDQISAAHPGGPLVVDPMSDAAGIWHPRRELYVMADDPRLGSFRQEFAGMLGFLEEDPEAGRAEFAEAAKIIDSAELRKTLDADPQERVDARAFLKARLFDDFIGDWDRHWDQWDWARLKSGGPWVAIPKDRDQAFAKFDGLVHSVARKTQPRFVNFKRTYPPMVGLNWNGQFIDRRLLTGLSRDEWQRVAHELQGRLTDAVIEKAVRALPGAYFARSGERLLVRLKGRRDRLPAAADHFYRLLAREVAIQGSDRPELAEIVREAGGVLEVRISEIRPDGNTAPPHYVRRFVPQETKEVRIFLAGGNDRAVTRGAGPHDIKLRVVGGEGEDVLDDREGGHTDMFDTGSKSQVLHGPGTSDSFHEYVHPLDKNQNPLRDWGRTFIGSPVLSGGADVGLLAGYQYQLTDYGFRKHDYASRQTLSGAYSTARKGFRFDYGGEFLRTNSRKRTLVSARASDIEVLRFFGFGNETSDAAGEAFHRFDMRQFILTPALSLPLADKLDFVFGPTVKYATTKPERGSFLDLTRPYGSGDFGQVGVTAAIRLDRRNTVRAATKGAFLNIDGTYYPKVWSVEEAFGNVRGELGTYLTAPGRLRPTLALRAGGKKLFGDFPFHESAFIGGPDTVRGLQRERYAGDASAYGTAELRVRLFRLRLLVPTDVGVFGLADGGRVFVDGEESDRWHHGEGGGVFFTFYRPENTLSAAAVKAEGKLRFYVQGGFAF
jgi:hypothetical protein